MTAKPKQQVAFIIPFRERHEHLGVWLRHMHPILRRQQLDYRVILVEQADNQPFNRAALMNVGVVEAKKIGDFSCFVYHDVDIRPEDDRANTGAQTRRLSTWPWPCHAGSTGSYTPGIKGLLTYH